MKDLESKVYWIYEIFTMTRFFNKMVEKNEIYVSNVITLSGVFTAACKRKIARIFIFISHVNCLAGILPFHNKGKSE